LMVDASESADSARMKLGSCLDVLDQLDVDPQRVLLVLNKIDLLKQGSAEGIEEDPRFKDFSSMKISAIRGDGLHKLRSRIVDLTRSKP